MLVLKMSTIFAKCLNKLLSKAKFLYKMKTDILNKVRGISKNVESKNKNFVCSDSNDRFICYELKCAVCVCF